MCSNIAARMQQDLFRCNNSGSNDVGMWCLFSAEGHFVAVGGEKEKPLLLTVALVFQVPLELGIDKYFHQISELRITQLPTFREAFPQRSDKAKHRVLPNDRSIIFFLVHYEKEDLCHFARPLIYHYIIVTKESVSWSP